ncbi:MAG: hypothetical protein IPJ66_13490 [Bacteroidetes bacterium]|nr:hypothetical protein [Bacteroidota bacterium]
MKKAIEDLKYFFVIFTSTVCDVTKGALIGAVIAFVVILLVAALVS